MKIMKLINQAKELKLLVRNPTLPMTVKLSIKKQLISIEKEIAILRASPRCVF